MADGGNGELYTPLFNDRAPPHSGDRRALPVFPPAAPTGWQDACVRGRIAYTSVRAPVRSPRRYSAPVPKRHVPLQPIESVPAGKPRARRGAPAPATQRIVEAISGAIVERRLAPGTRLIEQRIADVFAVSRTIVRQALNQLSRDRLVTLSPARGASVATPSVAEARQVFAARVLLEGAIVKVLCGQIARAQIVELRRHLAEQRTAIESGDVAGRTRLLSDFHVVLARMLGNEVLAQLVSDLLFRSSLVALMYQSAQSAARSLEEHAGIVDALEQRDVRTAVRRMERHVAGVERGLDLGGRAVDLASALKPPD